MKRRTLLFHVTSRLPTALFFVVLAMVAGCAQPAARNMDSGAPAGAAPALETATVRIVPTPTLLVTMAPESAAPASVASPTQIGTATAAAEEAPAISPTIPSANDMTVTQPDTGYPRPVDAEMVEQLLDGLALEEKIGQMFMVGMPGTELDNQTWQRIVNEGLGGVIFLEKNGASPEQVRTLTGAIQEAALNGGSGVPLFIAWNHEGGRVVRRGAGLTRFPSNMAVGATGQNELSFAIGQAVGEEMFSLGVNMNYAPVMDVNSEPANPVIGLRAYGDDPALVASMGERYIVGQQEAGVISVAKHFPGHGGVNIDSHVRLPLLSQDVNGLIQRELPPFQAAVSAGVGAIMVAHIEIPEVEGDGWPSSLSPRVVQGLLREQMGYEGVVMTDDLGMGALGPYSAQTRAVQAVLAGNDVLLTVDTQAYETYRNALLAAVRNGEIPEARIDDSVRRILRLKLAYDLAAPSSGEILPGLETHQQLMVDVGSAAVQLVRDEQGWLRLDLPNQRLLLITPDKFNSGSAAGDGVTLLGEYLRGRGIDVRELIYVYDSPENISRVAASALSQVGQVDAVVIVTWDAILRFAHFGETAQEQMVTDLLATGKPVIAVAGHLPYDSQRLTMAPALLKMYGDTPGQVAGTVSLLTGW